MGNNRPEGKLRVAAYCRVAAGNEGSLDCCAAQKAYYAQKIEENPEWELAGIFADMGLGATDVKKRKEFSRMISACQQGKIDLILTRSLSRFARSMVDGLEMMRTLKGLGVEIVFEKENIDTRAERGELLAILYSVFAQAESEYLPSGLICTKYGMRTTG